MNSIDDTRMSLGDHFSELRHYLIRALVGIGVGMVVCLIFGDRIMQFLCWPAAVAMEYRGLPMRLRALAPAESFTTYLKVCLICGVILSAPYSIRQIWHFVAAGLYEKERKFVQRYVPFSAGLFALGVAFFFFVIAPICMSFFIGFGQRNFPTPAWASPVLPGRTGEPVAETQPAYRPASQPAMLPVLDANPTELTDGQVWIDRPSGEIRIVTDGRIRTIASGDGGFLSTEITLGNYVTFVSWLALVFGIGFQTPICVMALAKTGVVPLAKMKAARKYVILAMTMAAALLTPPDVVSQIALAIPMYLLFELGLLLARGTKPVSQPTEG